VPLTHQRRHFHEGATRVETAQKLADDALHNPSHSLGTPASKGWRGFLEKSHVFAAHCAAVEPRGAPRDETWLTETTGREETEAEKLTARVQAGIKGERFRDLRSGAKSATRDITSNNPPDEASPRNAC
jgi:hypothetical protein